MEKNKIFWIAGALISGLSSFFLFSTIPYFPGFIYGLFFTGYFCVQSQKSFFNISSFILVLFSMAAFLAAYLVTINLTIFMPDTFGLIPPLFLGGIVGMCIFCLGLMATFVRKDLRLFFQAILLSGLLGQSFIIGGNIKNLIVPNSFFIDAADYAGDFPTLFLFVVWQMGVFLFLSKRLVTKE